MVYNIEPDQIEATLKQKEFVCLMFWADGCHYCEKGKPDYFKLSEKYPNISFLAVPFSNVSYSFYSKYIPKDVVEIEAKQEDGETIVDADGKPLMTVLKDDNGEVVYESPVSIPNFFVFHHDAVDESDEFGFLGNIDGLKLQQLEDTLVGITQQLEAEDE